MLYFLCSFCGICISLLQLLFFRETLSLFQDIDISVGFYVSFAFLFFTIGTYTFYSIKSFKKAKNSALINVALYNSSFISFFCFYM
jgi:hypothetical protein